MNQNKFEVLPSFEDKVWKVKVMRIYDEFGWIAQSKLEEKKYTYSTETFDTPYFAMQDAKERFRFYY